MRENPSHFSRAKAIFHGREKLAIFPFLGKPEKTALQLYLFAEILRKFLKN